LDRADLRLLMRIGLSNTENKKAGNKRRREESAPEEERGRVKKTRISKNSKNNTTEHDTSLNRTQSTPRRPEYAMSGEQERPQRHPKPVKFFDGVTWSGIQKEYTNEQRENTPCQKGTQEGTQGQKMINVPQELIEKIVKQNGDLARKLLEMGEKLASLEGETVALRSEVTALRGELKKQTQEKPTWAAIAAQRQGITADSKIHGTQPQPSNQAPPGITVNIAKLSDPMFDTKNPKEIRNRVLQAFKSHESTRDISWAGITIGTTDPNRVRIHLRTLEDVRKAKKHDEWTHSHFEGMRIQGDQWYPIKIDSVNKTHICDETRMNIREDTCERLGLENGVEIKKTRFLGRPNPDKQFCSVVIYLQNKEDAEALLLKRVLEIEGGIAYTKVYEPRTGPKRCFNCHKFGNHEARRCPEKQPTCGYCAKAGHVEEECVKESPECVNCGGPHSARDRGCPNYKKTLRETHHIHIHE
jgi:hypothetical protein